ncbi:hypothetical protein KUTeg_011028 [Tegillarca granosa]|uniref:C2H2-type domain-containing protein n=1 Tax=Tegillarca granosa TaxID=220873 RepID=A0ABQ9F2P8_TEGGR|nr:hypothetical protein KUTeg_011028 [Tegillarca granosa]
MADPVVTDKSCNNQNNKLILTDTIVTDKGSNLGNNKPITADHIVINMVSSHSCGFEIDETGQDHNGTQKIVSKSKIKKVHCHGNKIEMIFSNENKSELQPRVKGHTTSKQKEIDDIGISCYHGDGILNENQGKITICDKQIKKKHTNELIRNENLNEEECNKSVRKKNSKERECNEPIRKENTKEEECNEPIRKENTKEEECNEPIRKENTKEEECNKSIRKENTNERENNTKLNEPIIQECTNEEKLNDPIKSQKTYECLACNKTFEHQFSLQLHQNEHLNKRIYCKQCPRSFVLQWRYVNHLKWHVDQSKKKLNKPFKIHYNWKIFKKMAGYKLTSYMSKSGDLMSKSDYLKCNLCGLSFSRRYSLQLHKMKHSGFLPYKCNKCGNKYLRNCHLARHRMSKHKGKAKKKKTKTTKNSPEIGTKTMGTVVKGGTNEKTSLESLQNNVLSKSNKIHRTIESFKRKSKLKQRKQFRSRKKIVMSGLEIAKKLTKGSEKTVGMKEIKREKNILKLKLNKNLKKENLKKFSLDGKTKSVKCGDLLLNTGGAIRLSENLIVQERSNLSEKTKKPTTSGEKLKRQNDIVKKFRSHNPGSSDSITTIVPCSVKVRRRQSIDKRINDKNDSGEVTTEEVFFHPNNLGKVTTAKVPNNPHDSGEVTTAKVSNDPHDSGEVTTAKVPNIPQDSGEVTTARVPNDLHDPGEVTTAKVPNNPHDSGEIATATVPDDLHDSGELTTAKVFNNPQDSGEVTTARVPNDLHDSGEVTTAKVPNNPHDSGEVATATVPVDLHDSGEVTTAKVLNDLHDSGEVTTAKVLNDLHDLGEVPTAKVPNDLHDSGEVTTAKVPNDLHDSGEVTTAKVPNDLHDSGEVTTANVPNDLHDSGEVTTKKVLNQHGFEVNILRAIKPSDLHDSEEENDEERNPNNLHDSEVEIEKARNSNKHLSHQEKDIVSSILMCENNYKENNPNEQSLIKTSVEKKNLQKRKKINIESEHIKCSKQNNELNKTSDDDELPELISYVALTQCENELQGQDQCVLQGQGQVKNNSEKLVQGYDNGDKIVPLLEKMKHFDSISSTMSSENQISGDTAFKENFSIEKPSRAENVEMSKILPNIKEPDNSERRHYNLSRAGLVIKYRAKAFATKDNTSMNENVSDQINDMTKRMSRGKLNFIDSVDESDGFHFNGDIWKISRPYEAELNNNDEVDTAEHVDECTNPKGVNSSVDNLTEHFPGNEVGESFIGENTEVMPNIIYGDIVEKFADDHIVKFETKSTLKLPNVPLHHLNSATVMLDRIDVDNRGSYIMPGGDHVTAEDLASSEQVTIINFAYTPGQHDTESSGHFEGEHNS